MAKASTGHDCYGSIPQPVTRTEVTLGTVDTFCNSLEVGLKVQEH